MKKILDHFEANHLFLPIDHEISFAHDIILYMLIFDLVTYNDAADSDIQITSTNLGEEDYGEWSKCKEQVFENLPYVFVICRVFFERELKPLLVLLQDCFLEKFMQSLKPVFC